MRVAVTGASGFLGREVVRELEAEHELLCIDLGGPAPPGHELLEVTTAPDSLAKRVVGAQPDVLLHAAFQNRRLPTEHEDDYLVGQLRINRRLLRECARNGIAVLLVSSSAVYGAAGDRQVIGEETPRAPVSLYGLAKTLQETVASHFAAAHDLELCTVRLFNLIGPGQGHGMLIPDWVAKVSAIADGARPVLEVHNRATSRDFVDVRDAARALSALLDPLPIGEVFNVASGNAVSLVELSEALQSLCPVDYEVVERQPAPDGTDVAIQRGDASKLFEARGWLPRIDWRQSLRDVWNSYRVKRPSK